MWFVSIVPYPNAGTAWEVKGGRVGGFAVGLLASKRQPSCTLLERETQSTKMET